MTSYHPCIWPSSRRCELSPRHVQFGATGTVSNWRHSARSRAAQPAPKGDPWTPRLLTWPGRYAAFPSRADRFATPGLRNPPETAGDNISSLLSKRGEQCPGSSPSLKHSRFEFPLKDSASKVLDLSLPHGGRLGELSCAPTPLRYQPTSFTRVLTGMAG